MINENMNILLINPPKEKEFTLFVLDDYNKKARSNQPPLGLMYLYSYLSDEYNVSILDMNSDEISISDIGKYLKITTDFLDIIEGWN